MWVWLHGTAGGSRSAEVGAGGCQRVGGREMIRRRWERKEMRGWRSGRWLERGGRGEGEGREARPTSLWTISNRRMNFSSVSKSSLGSLASFSPSSWQASVKRTQAFSSS
jgi:hypothetical protein